MDPAELSILVVDDEGIVAQALAAALRGANRRVLICTDPSKVAGLMAADRVDLIISDEHMPGMNGVRLLAALRETHPETTRVLLTGNGTVETASQAINDAHVFKFLTKPWRREQLDSIVEGARQRTLSQRKAPAAVPAGDRRRAMLEELEREHPGIIHAPPGVYPLHPTQVAEALIEIAEHALHLDEEVAARLDAPAGKRLVASDPLALTDALLLTMFRHPELSFVIEPTPAGHAVTIETGTASHVLLVLPRGLGDTVAARCGVLAELDVGRIGELVGHRSFKLGAETAEIMVVLRTSSVGLAAELRRVEQTGEHAPAGPASTSLGNIGPYRVLDVLGHGGLGVVYRAVHEVLERPVAVKVLHSPAQDKTTSARFLREARAASRAKHPGIVDVVDFGRCPDGRPYLVMEIVEAPTLEQRLAHGALPLEDAVAIGESIASALAAAHDAGVIHRDLKPSNIFVDDDLRAKISDFGAAKMIGGSLPSLTQEGTTIGTPLYMSPEQARGLDVDRRSDLYALGCVLYEMIAGVCAFEGQTSMDVLTQHLHAPVPVPVSPHGPVPHALVRVIRRAMAKSPSERHQTAAELIADLAQASLSLGRSGWRRWLP